MCLYLQIWYFLGVFKLLFISTYWPEPNFAIQIIKNSELRNLNLVFDLLSMCEGSGSLVMMGRSVLEKQCHARRTWIYLT